MSALEATQSKLTSPQAVDEEYEKLERFHVERRRLVFFDNQDPSHGGFGLVLRAELHESAYLPAWLAVRRYGPPQLVAVKQIKVPPGYNTARVKRAFTREMLVWSSAGEHPGIAKFLGFHADFKYSEAWLLSPWEPNGNVSDFIKKHKLEVPEKLSLIYDTIDALTFLHQLTPPVCHGDIKSPNVLVTADYKARLCDFGLARLHEDSGFGRLETSTGTKGSIRWCSPEILDGRPRTPASDVYAWAWLVWEIMTGDLPYQGTSADYAIMKQIFESPLPQVDGTSRLSDCLQVWELIRRCWNVEPGQRPTASMCKTTVTYLPRCTPTPVNGDHQFQSAALLENLGALETWKGNPEKSAAYLNRAMRLYEEEGDRRGICSVLRKQAAAAYRNADWPKLRPIASTALEHCKALNDVLGIAETSYYLGHSLGMLDEMDNESSFLQQSLEIRRTHGDEVGVVQCIESIADTLSVQGQRHEALSRLDEAMAIATRSGDQLGLATVLRRIGHTHRQLSDYVKAAEALSQSIAISRSVGFDRELNFGLAEMGEIKMELGEYQEAEGLLQESVSVARRARLTLGLADALQELGDCFRKQSKLIEAVAALEESCRLWIQYSQPSGSRWPAFTLVGLKSSQGDWDGALFWHDHLIVVDRGLKKYSEVADHLERKAEILVKRQRYDEAALHLEAAMLTRMEHTDSTSWERREIREKLCAIPKTVMKWERRLPLLCDAKQLHRRLPQLITAVLKPATPTSHTQPYPSILDLDS